MGEYSYWLVQCGDDACWPCDSMSRAGRLVQAPIDWEAPKVVRTLQIQGWTCDTGNPIQFADLWGPTDEEPEIRLVA
jgi:hypothetical protein